jgi:predicted ester cyclase
MFHKAFPDLHVEIDQIIAEGDLVVTAITSTATHQGEVMGIPATGKKISVRGVHINKIVDGRIVARWELTDMMGLMVQLGVVTPPGA